MVLAWRGHVNVYSSGSSFLVRRRFCRVMTCSASLRPLRAIFMQNPTEHFEAASTLAVVVSSNEPLLFLSDDLRVIAASASFCRAFEIDPATVPGRRLGE